MLKAYGEREYTRLEHVRELRQVLAYTEFAGAEADLRAWVDARACRVSDVATAPPGGFDPFRESCGGHQRR